MASVSNYGQTLARIIFSLVVIQIARALMAFLLSLVTARVNSILILQWFNSATFVIVGGGMLAWRRPSTQALGLSWQNVSRREKIVYGGGAFVVAGLIVASLLIDANANLANLHFAIVIPLFEEVLFRGWAWSKFTNALDGKWAGLVTWLTVTVLFGVWHLGYFDVLLRNPVPLHGITLQWLMISKVMVGLGLGALVGLARWRTGRVYGGILIHALWNLFA